MLVRHPGGAGNRSRAAATLAAAALALAGCGGGGDDSSSAGGLTTFTNQPTTDSTAGSIGTTPSSATSNLNARDQIAHAVEGILTSGDPSLACDRYPTESYLEVNFGGLEGCRQSTLPGSAADAVEFGAIAIDGSRARVIVVPTGGPSSGETITVKLVREGSVWKVDTLRSNAPVGP